jgi:hypothetical protein
VAFVPGGTGSIVGGRIDGPRLWALTSDSTGAPEAAPICKRNGSRVTIARTPEAPTTIRALPIDTAAPAAGTAASEAAHTKAAAKLAATAECEPLDLTPAHVLTGLGSLPANAARVARNG